MTAPARTAPSGPEIIPTTLRNSGNVAGVGHNVPAPVAVSDAVPVKRGALQGMLNVSAVVATTGGGNLLLRFLPADGGSPVQLMNWGWNTGAGNIHNWDNQAFFAIDVPAEGGTVQLFGAQSQDTTYSGAFSTFQPRASV
jgi:hypothetical protein